MNTPEKFHFGFAVQTKEGSFNYRPTMAEAKKLANAFGWGARKFGFVNAPTLWKLNKKTNKWEVVS